LNPRLRNVAFAALLLVLPLSGIRVICVESPSPEGDSAVPATAPEAEAVPLTDCERLCPFHPPESVAAPHADAASTPDEDADCALSSDAAALQMLGTIAVLRPAPPVIVPDVVSDAPVFASSIYSEPTLALLAPPPKPSAL
jgi:hypothetical protein